MAARGKHIVLAEETWCGSAAQAQPVEEAVYVGDWNEAAIVLKMLEPFGGSAWAIAIETADEPFEDRFVEVGKFWLTPTTDVRLVYTRTLGNWVRWNHKWAGGGDFCFSVGLWMR